MRHFGSDSLSDRHMRWFCAVFYRPCPDCGGDVLMSELSKRGGNWPQESACESCGERWRVPLSRPAYVRKFMLTCVPLVLVSVFLTSALLEFVFPTFTYETETGLAKLRFWAFPFLLVAFLLPALIWTRRLPLEKSSQ